eukprot:jgi/Galph1/3993/GphlegSOOS_G2689.1
MSESLLAKLRKVPHKLYILLVVCALGGSVVGIDTALVSGAQLFFISRFHLDPSLQGLTTAATLLGALIGSFLSILLNAYVGRKGAMFFAGLDAIAAGLIEGFSNMWGILLLGRLILGVAFGILTSTIPMFLSECPPVAIRGIFTAVYQFAYALGYFIGLIINVIFVNVEHGWRFMLGSVTVPALFVVLGLHFACESPRWLLMNERENAAWDSLRQLRSSDEVATASWEEIKVLVERERLETKLRPSFLRTVYAKPSIRRLLFLGAALQTAQQLSGVNAVMYYFDYVLQLAGMSNARSIDVSVSLGFVTVAFGVPTFFLVDRLGRRILLLTTMPFLSMTLWMCGFSFFGGKEVKVALNIAGTLLFRMFFGPGLGPMPWVLIAEIYPSSVRSQCLTFNSFCSYMMNFVIAFSWPNMLQSMHGQGAYSFFAGFTLLSTLFFFLFLPETKGVEMENIQRMFEEPFYAIARKNLSAARQAVGRLPVIGKAFHTRKENLELQPTEKLSLEASSSKTQPTS